MSAVVVSSAVGLQLPELLLLLLILTVVSVESAEETAARRLRLFEESDDGG